MKSYHIAIIPGDGVGVEVAGEGAKILDAVAEKYGRRFQCHFSVVSAAQRPERQRPFPRPGRCQRVYKRPAGS